MKTDIFYNNLIILLPIFTIGSVILISLLCFWIKENITEILALVGIIITLILIIGSFVLDLKQNTFLFNLDNFFFFFSTMILISNLMIGIQSRNWLLLYPGSRDEFFLFILISTIGGILLSGSNHLSVIFLGIELISVSSMGMMGYEFSDRYSLNSGIKYVLLSMATSSFLLFGMAMIYVDIGQLSFDKMGEKMMNGEFHSISKIGLGLILVGLGFKLSIFPFHSWVSEVYKYFSFPVCSFLSSTQKIAIFSSLFRLFSTLSLIENKNISSLIEIMAVLSMLIGSWITINQRNIKNIIGCSSIVHFGYLLAGIAIMRIVPVSKGALVIYLINYMFSCLGIFGTLNILCKENNMYKELYDIHVLKGSFHKSPFLSVVLTVFLFSLLGIPITFGFFSKFYIVHLIVQSHLNGLLVPFFISSIIGSYYYVRMIANIYLLPIHQKYDEKITLNRKYSLDLLAITISLLIVIFFGIFPKFPVFLVSNYCL